MTIRNMEAFTNSLWDWAILDGCFGSTRIRPTDIDGLVERNGKFLMLEAKGMGVAIPFGQRITFDSLVSTGVFTVVVVWGTPGNVQHVQVWPDEVRAAGREELRAIVSSWFRKANNCRNLQEVTSGISTHED